MREDRQVGFWIAALVVVVIAIAVLGDVLLPFVVGATIAFFLDPVAERLERLGFNRTASAALIVGLAGLTVLAAIVFLLPLAMAQLGQLAQSLPADIERLKGGAEAWISARFPGLKGTIERAYGEIAQGASGFIPQLLRGLWSQGLALVNLVSLMLVTPIVVFYLLRDWKPMLARIDNWLPREHAPAIRIIAADIERAVGAFIRGQGTICLILGIFYAAALSAVGLKYGLVIGLATGILAFVPFVGWALGLVTAAIVALSQGWPDTSLALWVAGIFAGGMALDSAVLSPGIVGQRIGLHPVWLLFALFVFSGLFGFTGTLVAVPVAAAIAVVVRFARDRYLASSIYLGDPPSGGPET